MSKRAVVSARISPELKHNAEEIFKELGLTATQAIQVELCLLRCEYPMI